MCSTLCTYVQVYTTHGKIYHSVAMVHDKLRIAIIIVLFARQIDRDLTHSRVFCVFLLFSVVFTLCVCVYACVCLPVVVFVLMTSFAHIFGSRVPPFAADLSTINFRQNHTAINLSCRGCVILWQHSIRRPGWDESRACVRIMCVHI